MTPGSEDAAATDADKPSGDGMATDKDEETSGDAEHGVTIGGEKDPSLSKKSNTLNFKNR